MIHGGVFRFLAIHLTLLLGCCFGQGQWGWLVEKDLELSNDQRFSSESFEKDKAMGIQYLADPQSIRQVGARQFHVWHDLPIGNMFYLRVARGRNELASEDFDNSEMIFSDWDWNTIDTVTREAREVSGLNYIEGPLAMNTTLRTHEYTSWDYIYQKSIDETGYYSIRSNRVRRYLLNRRYQINALFKTPWGADGLLDRHNASRFTVEADTTVGGQAIGFLFDSDPFGFGYTRPQNQRLAANLSGRNGQVYYQWVRVRGGNEYFYGDIHECNLPRAAYVGIIGDSYSSGEGAPFTEGSSSAFGIGNWITSYVDSEHKAHRSYSSGWQKAMNQHVRQAFATTSIDFNDVSRSGAQARWKDCDTNSFIDENRLNLSGTRVSGGNLRTAARQKLLLDDILERDSQQKLDILGFTFGGNDAYFSKMINAMLLLDLDDEDYTLSNIGDIDDDDYPSLWPFFETGSPFPSCAPGSFYDMIDEAKPRVADIRGNDHGFEIGYQLRGNYCNPVGAMWSYSPDAVPGGGIIAQLDREETDLIRSTIMPQFNDELVTDQSTTPNSRVIDTRLPTPESEGLPHNHSHHILSAHDEWFNEMYTRETSNSRFNYAFHPNARGHDNIYRPVYYYQLKDELKASRRREIYEGEAEDPDLVDWLSSLVYEDGTLRMNVIAANIGNRPTEPSYLNMRVTFGPRVRQRYASGWIVGSRSSSFEIPLRDIENNPIVIDPIAPGDLTWQLIDLEKGELECVYYNLIINHFLQIADTELIRETIGSYSPAQMFARFAAFIPLFGHEGVSFAFRFTPVDGRPEVNMRNNMGDYYSLPFEINLENFFGWIVKTRNQVYEDLISSVAGRGIELEKLGSYDMEDLYGDPANLEKDFGVTTLGQKVFDRDAVEPELVFDASMFGEIYEVVDSSLDLGLLAPKPIVIDPDLLKDYLVVKSPTGEKKIPFRRWYEVESVLPKDGGLLEVAYCRAEKNDDPSAPTKYTDIPIKVKTNHSYDGLENFYENKILNNGTLALKVDFAERPTLPDLAAFSRVVVKDTLTGAIFYDRLHLQETEVDDLDLTNILFHSANVSVEISTDSKLASSFYKIKHGNESSVTQNNLSRSGAFLEFELIMRGSAAVSFSNNLEIEIPNNPTSKEEGVPARAKLVVASAENTEEDGQKIKVVTVKMPLDLVYNGPKVIRITDLDNLENTFISSIATSGLQNLLPLGGISQVEAISVELDHFNLNAIFKEPASGIIIVDESDDMESWSRVYSGMAADNVERKIGLQPKERKKGFVRARRYILSEK